jgi:DNA-binding transcriptional ArsR family regulator
MLKLKCQKCFEILSVPARFKIYYYLKDKTSGTTVNRLVKLTKLRQPTVTFHLNALEKQGLISKTRSGKEVLCSIKQNCDLCPLFSN